MPFTAEHPSLQAQHPAFLSSQLRSSRTHCFPCGFDWRPLWITDTWSPRPHLLAHGLTSLKKVILSFPSPSKIPLAFKILLRPLLAQSLPGFCLKARVSPGGKQEVLLESRGVQSAFPEHAPPLCYLPVQHATVSR